ncbi:MAG: hypothetical protein K8I00_10965 [Candidatus Omnitrophica bacterium]|nr:hypothetical protein [Candidatus Omnitrophota bacterium]
MNDNKLSKEYDAYLNSIMDKIPMKLRNMIELTNRFDSTLLSFELIPNENKATLEIIAEKITSEEKYTDAHMQFQYFGLVQVRSFCKLNEGHPMPLGFGDLLWEEFELLPNESIEHRLLYSSGINYCIQFTDFDYVFLKA